MTFDELNIHTSILQALNDLEYIYPTPIQAKAYPVIMSGRDVVGIAQTGTGKTYAYLLPIIRQLPYSDQKPPRALIVVPTRELVLQIVDEIKKLIKYTSLRCGGVYGGANINTQKQLVYDGLDILVATPGRLMDLAMNGVLRLKNVQKLVIDEVDEMLNLGFRIQLTHLLDALPAKRQNLMFSATLTPDVEALIGASFNNPEKIEITPHGTPLEKIIQRAYYVPNIATKINLLELLLASDPEMTKVLVFVATKKLADRLFEQASQKYPEQIGLIHSNRTQSSRINALKLFEEGTHRVLIATDVIARGLDLMDITHVINFDTPDVPGDYIHRIGRTGRADKAGISITFITEMEREYQHAIEHLMQKKIPMQLLPEQLPISTLFTEEERPSNLYDKHYMKAPSLKNSKGAFHDKKDKNKKVNLGGPKKKSQMRIKSAKKYRSTR